MIMMQCVNAYMAVQTLMDREMDYQTAYALVCLKKELSGPVEFYKREERRRMDEFAARDEDDKGIWNEGGRFQLRDPEAAQLYRSKRAELDMVEIKQNIIPVRVPRPDRIKPAVLEALDGFLIFEEGTQ